MAGGKKGPSAKGKPPPAKGRQQTVRRPPAQAPRSRGVMAPVATNVSNGRNGSKTVRIMERERVFTLNGSAAFKVQKTIQINPALSAFLPWLSTMAQLYEKYRVKSIRVMYHNLCGTNAAGNVLMSYDPDVLDSAPADAVSFSQSTRYIDGAPWRMLTLNIPGSNQALFTRSAGAPSGSDLKTYDYGQIHIATEAMADESSVGYVEIAYDFEFLERQPAPASGGGYSFRPQLYAGVPDSTQPVVLKHLHYNGSIQSITYDGILPLKALVDDIGVSAFNGSLVLPPGSFALSTSQPTGGYAADATADTPTSVGPLAPELASRLITALGITPIEGRPPIQPPKFTGDGVPTYKWVDSAGATIDAVGIADLTGVSLLTSFEVDICDSRVSGGSPIPAYQVNNRPIEGSGSFSTVLSPQLPGEGIWPTAVITQLA